MTSVLESRLLPALFQGRPNRFIVEARLDSGETARAHLADPGRLLELLQPGAALRLRRAPEGHRRRTDYTVALVRTANDSWVSLEPARANHWVRPLLERGEIPLHGPPVERVEATELPKTKYEIQAEVTSGKHRFDFRVRSPSLPPVWVEVKAVGWCVDGVGRFPDAPTARGVRHVEALTRLQRNGEAACLILVGMRDDIREIRPFETIDPDWAAAVETAREAGVRVQAVGFSFDGEGQARYRGLLPFRDASG